MNQAHCMRWWRNWQLKTVTLEAITLITTSAARIWKKVKHRSGLYFTADLELSCENLVREIYGAASADQGHLELKGFEWLDLSDPLVTLKIVLPWYDKTSECTTLKRLRVGDPGQSRAWIPTGYVNKQLETVLPIVNQSRGPGDSQNLKTKAFPEVSF